MSWTELLAHAAPWWFLALAEPMAVGLVVGAVGEQLARSAAGPAAAPGNGGTASINWRSP